MSGQSAKRRRPRGRKREDRPWEARFRRERAQVLCGLLDVALAWHHDERRLLDEQQRQEQSRGPSEPGEPRATRRGEPHARVGEHR